MFDIGFSELLLVAIVGLIVVGPEKLPTTLRMGFRYFRQFRESFNGVRHEIERELRFSELHDDINRGKDQLTQIIGYDELHDSLDSLKEQTEEFAEKGNWQEIDEAIENDLKAMSDKAYPPPPDMDKEAETGIEPEV